MLSNRPYLLRAFYQWIVDSACIPILVIDATHPQCKIPRDYVEGGEIVFNISSTAVRDLKISNELVEFKASFSGVIHIVAAPIKAVIAVYAEENGEGLFFDAEDSEDGSDARLLVKDLDITNTISSIEPEIAAREKPVRSKPVLKLIE